MNKNLLIVLKTITKCKTITKQQTIRNTQVRNKYRKAYIRAIHTTYIKMYQNMNTKVKIRLYHIKLTISNKIKAHMKPHNKIAIGKFVQLAL